MSEGIYEFEEDVIGTNTDCPTYANVGAYKPKPGGVVIQRSASVFCQWWKRPSGVAAVCLGLLCFLLLAGIIGLSVHYGVTGNQYTETDKLQTRYNNLSEARDQLQASYKTMSEERDKLQRERDIFQAIYGKYSNEWKVFGKSIYYISTEQNNWEYANQDCLKRGTHLVIINNLEEQKFLISLNIRTWIGLTDSETEGTWKWVDGTPLTTAYWGAPQPDNGGGTVAEEDCAEFVNWYSDPVKKWNDIPCTLQHKWICEQVIN